MGQIKMSPSVVFKFLASETPENYILFFVLIMFFKINSWDFPGRPVAKTQGFHHKEPKVPSLVRGTCPAVRPKEKK